MHGKVLDVSASGRKGTAAVIWTENWPHSDNQLWRLEPSEEDGWFHIVSKLCPDLVLDVKGGSDQPGTEVIVWERKCAPTPNQLWRLRDEFLETALGCELVLDIKGSRVDDGTPTIAYDRNSPCDDDNQKWQIDHE